jgi:hypothetical protein
MKIKVICELQFPDVVVHDELLTGLSWNCHFGKFDNKNRNY